MKMRRIVAAILLVFMAVSSVSCTIPFLGDIFESDSGDSLNLSSGYTIAYSRASESDVRMEAMIKNEFAKFGGKVDSNSNKLKSFDKEIILGGMDSKEETKALVKSLKADTNDMLGAYVVRAIGKKVFVYASCPEAEKLAVNALFSYVSDGKLIVPKDLDITVYFNLYEYKNNGELLQVSDGLSGITEPAFIKIDGMPIQLQYGVYEYILSASPTDAFPTEDEIEVTLYSDEMSYAVSYVENSVVVTFTSKDGTKTQDYKFTYGFDDEYVVATVIVNKDGAKGALSMIADDGDERTADFFYSVVAPQYSAFKITIAMATRDIATLQSAGASWAKDENGNYIYTIGKNPYTSTIEGSPFRDHSQYETADKFWQQILSSDQFEMISHSHSHSDWPVNDDIQYAENGTVKYPAGSVLKEIEASAQILEELFGQTSPFIARPGGNFWADTPGVDHSPLRNYFYALVDSNPTFVGMRTSNGGPPLPGSSQTKLNSPKMFASSYDGGAWEDYLRMNIGCLLVKGNQTAFNADGTGYAYPSGGNTADVLAAGIGAWENYINLAIENGKWASIAFHDVFDEDTARFIGDGYPVADAQVLALMAYVQPLVDSGDLWVGTFSEIAEYYFQWSTAEVSAKAYGDDRVEITLTDGEEDSRMDSALTIKVNVPGNWTKAELDTNGEKTILDVRVDENGSCFVYANIVPDAEGVSVLTPVK